MSGRNLKNLLQIENFNPKTLIYHYISLCKKHYDRCINENKKVTHKIYLYMMRGLLNALYVYKTNNIPPLDFTQTVEHLKNDIPDDIYKKVKEIIQIKSSGLEKDTINRIELLDKFIEKYIEMMFDTPEHNIDVNVLNNFLIKEIISKESKLNLDLFKNNSKPNSCKNSLTLIFMVLFILTLVLTFLGY